MSSWLAGLIVMAPHVMVEDISITSIAAAKEAYRTTDLPQKLARYHADVDAASWGWNNIWPLRPGKSSLVLHVSGQSAGETRVEAMLTLLLASLTTRRSVPIAGELREKLERYPES